MPFSSVKRCGSNLERIESVSQKMKQLLDRKFRYGFGPVLFCLKSRSIELIFEFGNVGSRMCSNGLSKRLFNSLNLLSNLESNLKVMTGFVLSRVSPSLLLKEPSGNMCRPFVYSRSSSVNKRILSVKRAFTEHKRKKRIHWLEVSNKVANRPLKGQHFNTLPRCPN